MVKEARQKLAAYGKKYAESKLAETAIINYFTKNAEEIVNDMPREELQNYKIAEIFGRGMARGYSGAIQDNEKYAEQCWNTFCGLLARVTDEKTASKVAEKIAELPEDVLLQEQAAQEAAQEQPPAEQMGQPQAGQAEVAPAAQEEAPIEGEDDEIKEEIANGVIPVVVEQMGGKEEIQKAIEQDPDVERQLEEAINDITEQAFQEMVEQAPEQQQ